VLKPSISNRYFPARGLAGIRLAGILLVAIVVVATAALIVGSPITGNLASLRPALVNPTGSLAAPTAAAITPATRARISASYAALPLGFEANQGQVDPRVKYLARGNGYALFLTADDAVISLYPPAQRQTATSRRLDPRTTNASRVGKTQELSTSVMRMHLVNGNSQTKVTASDRLPGRINYYLGNDPNKWQTNVGQYARVSYENVYPGVNMAFHGAQRQMEFDFIVAPGASPAPIELGFSGARKISTDGSGNLVLSAAAGDLMLHRPVAYQEQNGSRQPVDARFVVKANNEVAFALGPYDRSRELVIDPSVTYATYLGGTAEDDGNAIAIDGSGNAYVTGQTQSTNFPTTAGVLQTTNAGGSDVFVTKISADGSTLVYSTYIGGSGSDSGNAIAVDVSGDAFVAGGTSSTNFPHTAGAFQAALTGALNAFVLELNPGGAALLYSTYLGGNGSDVANGIAIDTSGAAYVVGSTSSTNFPGTSSSLIQNALKGTSNGFATKVSPGGSALAYSTYLGGGSNDLAIAVALDSLDQAYVTGATKNKTFPVTAGVFQPTCGTDGNCNGGLYDAFVSVINAGGTAFVYSTFLGGEAADEGFGIAVDLAGDAFVTGLTSSSGHFPLKSALQATYGGGATDAFVTELNPQGSTLMYSTFLGGSGNDTGTGIALDANRIAYVTGQTSSTDFKLANPTQTALAGGNDAFVSEISSSGSTLLFSTYLGGTLNENTSAANGGGAIGAIAVSVGGANIYVTGNTVSPDFPTHNPKQSSNAGGTDAFVAKFTQPTTPDFFISATALSPASVAQGASATSTVTVTALNGYAGTVKLTCTVTGSGSPPPNCTLSPTSTTGSGTSTLTVHAIGASGALLRPSSIFYASWLPMIGLSLMGMRFSSAHSRRKKLAGLLLVGLVMTMLFFLPACGSSSHTTPPPPCSGCTPAGNYTVNVTGTDSSANLTHSLASQLALTVQ
jgi:hypothetical protein